VFILCFSVCYLSFINSLLNAGHCEVSNVLLTHCCRSDVWRNNVVMRTFTQQDWLQNFRMCKETFLYICNRSSSELERSDMVMQRPLFVQRRVAVCLWCLSTPIEYRTIAHLFGLLFIRLCMSNCEGVDERIH